MLLGGAELGPSRSNGVARVVGGAGKRARAGQQGREPRERVGTSLRVGMGPPEHGDSTGLSETGAKRHPPPPPPPPSTMPCDWGAGAAVVARTTRGKALGRDSAQSPLTDTA